MQEDADEGDGKEKGPTAPKHPEQQKTMRFMWVQRINHLLLLIASYV